MQEPVSTDFGRSATPPATGWRVPYDGQIDPSFAITAGTASSYAAIQGYGQYGQSLGLGF